MRKYFLLVVALAMVLSFAGFAQATPQVVLDGQTLSFDVQPVMENDRTLVPLRAIFEALGADVQWDNRTQTVTATKDGTEVKLVIGGHAYKNGATVALDVPAKLVNDRTMVPLRFVSEALGAAVNWYGATETIYIASPGALTTVHYIDVGQADAIYCQLPAHYDILIDTGNEADGSAVVSYLKSQGVDNIELLVSTHPHEDHIGGAPAVLDAFAVDKILDSGYLTDSKISADYQAKVQTEGAVYEADNHQTYTFGNVALQVLTGPETWEDVNNYSLVCRLDTGNIEFLFTGDAEGPAEAALSDALDAEIMKVGHHGSLTSTAASFLSKVSPKVAVISVGADNSYGHPAAETIQRLQAAGVEVYRTDLNGNIVISTNGYTYDVKVNRQSINPQPTPQPLLEQPAETTGQYVGSVKSNKYHLPTCRYAETITLENQIWFQTEEEAQATGYEPCGVCEP